MLFLLTNEKDEVNFKRMINKPARGIGPGALDSILSFAPQTDGSLFAMLRLAIDQNVLSAKAKAGASQFLKMFEHAKTLLGEGELVDCANFLIREAGLVDYYEELDSQNSTGKVGNLEALVNALSSYESSLDGLLQFLEQLSLDPTTLGREDPRDKEGVTLITMHNTKGLEFDRVFVAGLEEELFPGRAGESDDDIEEERRIFYVAVTRARKELYLLCARARKIWGKTSFHHPSRFLKEIDSSLVHVQGIEPGTQHAGGYQGLSSLGEKRREHQSGGATPSGWGSDGKVLIRKGFGDNAKTFTMKTVHTEADGGPLFPVGQRVYSDSYGEGEVVTVRMNGDREVIEVRFSGGRKATFISKFAQLEKIGSE
ncbi:ATP-dependent DNA helicase PcrA [anaerobic digester metagenome]